MMEVVVMNRGRSVRQEEQMLIVARQIRTREMGTCRT